MPAKLKPASPADLDRVKRTIDYIKRAIAELPRDCPKAKSKLRSALKSTQGAERHMRRRIPTTTVIRRENGDTA